jgi:hypothetical protein
MESQTWLNDEAPDGVKSFGAARHGRSRFLPPRGTPEDCDAEREDQDRTIAQRCLAAHAGGAAGRRARKAGRQ